MAKSGGSHPWLGGISALTIFGTLFSIYLTAIELVAIKAICAWCLSSAVLMALLMVIVAQSARQRSQQLKLGV